MGINQNQTKNYAGERPWQERPWLEQEKPSWFTFAPPFQGGRQRTIPKVPLPASQFPHRVSQPNPVRQAVKIQSTKALHNNKYPAGNQRLSRPTYSLLTYYKYHWIDKELLFAMNKLSIVGMVAGLMFLGALFFMSGFLLAFSLYGLPGQKTIESKLPAELGHRPSPDALATIHKPTPLKPAATVPSNYARVGGVAMVQPPHLPSHSAVQPPVNNLPAALPSSPQPVYQNPVYNQAPSAPPPYAAPGYYASSPPPVAAQGYGYPSATYGPAGAPYSQPPR